MIFARRSAFRLGLAGDRADHAVVEIDLLDLDGADLDAPRLGLLVEDLLQVGVQLVAFAEHLVERVLAEHRAQRGLRELAGGLQEILDADHRAVGIDDAEIEHRVDLHRDVVARDHVLARHVEHDRAQIDAHHLLHVGHQEDQARALHAGEAAEGEHHRALVLAHHPDRRAGDQQDQQQDDEKGRGTPRSCRLLSALPRPAA